MAKTDTYLKARYMAAIDDEFEKACRHYPKFASEHEGFAIIAEEMDELWDAVRLKQSDEIRYAQCEKEAIQVAAMALRFLHDLHDFKRN
jgi:hypothetical protein